MALREEFESSGKWLFRWRGFLPLILVVLFVLAMPDYHYLSMDKQLELYWKILCLLVSFAGLGVRVFTIGYTPRKTSGRNRKKQVAETLNTTGIYSVVRNPLYLGNFLMIFGLALFTHFWWLVLIYTLVFWLYYERIIFTEEAFLREKFGDVYLSWAEQTPAFIPKFKNYQKSNLRFSLRNVLKREYNGLFAMILSFTILDIAANYVAMRKFELDMLCQILLGFGFLVWLILRILKKTTKILDVQGR